MALPIAVVSDWTGRNDSTVHILHEIASMFTKFPTVAAATIAWIDSIPMVSPHCSQSI